MPLIYAISNELNSKEYIGQTRLTEHERFARHCGEARWKNRKKMPIVHAISKYGELKFKIRVLQTLPDCCTQEELDNAEILWVGRLNTMSPNGYNLRAGQGRMVLSEESKTKIRARMLGRKATPETIERLKKSHLGKKMSESGRVKLKERYAGRQVAVPTRYKVKSGTLVSPNGQVIRVTNFRKFCRENDLSPPKICLVLRGERNHHKGWRRPIVQT